MCCITFRYPSGYLKQIPPKEENLDRFERIRFPISKDNPSSESEVGRGFIEDFEKDPESNIEGSPLHRYNYKSRAEKGHGDR